MLPTSFLMVIFINPYFTLYIVGIMRGRLDNGIWEGEEGKKKTLDS